MRPRLTGMSPPGLRRRCHRRAAAMMHSGATICANDGGFSGLLRDRNGARRRHRQNSSAWGACNIRACGRRIFSGGVVPRYRFSEGS